MRQHTRIMLVARFNEIKTYVDPVAACDADSSYDSDDENATAAAAADQHEQVSRTTSDTLDQEFADYVNQPGVATVADRCSTSSAGYTQRVEFALKLGYTERLVQAALARLGPQPAQNELLAELIKLGSQPGHGDEFGSAAAAAAAAANNGGDLTPPTDAMCATPCMMSMSADHAQSPSLYTKHCPQTPLGPGESEPEFPKRDPLAVSSGLRPIVIDGSNLAMGHGNKETFSCRGIKLCVDWFRARGHREITVFVPKYRKESPRMDNPIRDQALLLELEQRGVLVFTPSRFVNGKRQVCYDDRYILKLAVDNDGIVVSNDNYRDLTGEHPDFKRVVNERLLMYSFVNDRFMPPDDPLGRSGPTLDNFLRVHSKKTDQPPPCPYGKKCTYGNKCKFHHPERGCGPHKTVTERLSEHAARHLSARNLETLNGKVAVQGKSLSVPLCRSSNAGDTSPVNNGIGCGGGGGNGGGGGMGGGVGGCGGERARRPLGRARSGMPGECGPCYSSGSGGSVEQMMHSQQQQQHQQQQQQQHHHPHTSQPVFGYGGGNGMPSQWETSAASGCASGFPKSHSIENISPDMYGGGAVYANSNYHNAAPMWPGHQHHQQQQQQQPPQHMQCQPQQQQQQQHGDGDDCANNIHRTLQRQLTLNPAGCDPRIGQMQSVGMRGVGGQMQQQQQQHQHHQQQHPLHVSPHRLLAPTASGPRTMQLAHQNVTRIASAPDQLRSWPIGPAPVTSNSEPHIGARWSHQQQQQQQQQQSSAQPPAGQPYPPDRRHHLQYHLASIFPEEQVLQVMQMYPDETNPQKICAAILNMFPKM